MTLSPPVRRILLPILWVTVIAVLAVGFLPFAWWTSFLIPAVRARQYLGRWPSYDHPDPKQLPADFGSIPEWVENAVPLLVLAALVGGTLLVMTRRVPKRWWLWTAVVVWLVAWGCSYGLLAADPGGFAEWALD
jgi:hypothetical protein